MNATKHTKSASKHTQAPAPFIERRHDRRRAGDKLPVVDADKLLKALQTAILSVLAPAQRNMLPNPAPQPLAAPAPAKRRSRRGKPQPAAESVRGRLYALYDTVGKALTVKQAKEIAKDSGFNENTAGIAYYRWRKDR